MEIISKEQADSMLLLTGGRELAISGKLKSLAVGEALIIKRSEWKARYAPMRITRRLEKTTTWRFRSGRLPDNSGWLIQRMA